MDVHLNTFLPQLNAALSNLGTFRASIQPITSADVYYTDGAAQHWACKVIVYAWSATAGAYVTKDTVYVTKEETNAMPLGVGGNACIDTVEAWLENI